MLCFWMKEYATEVVDLRVRMKERVGGEEEAENIQARDSSRLHVQTNRI